MSGAHISPGTFTSRDLPVLYRCLREKDLTIQFLQILHSIVYQCPSLDNEDVDGDRADLVLEKARNSTHPMIVPFFSEDEGILNRYLGLINDKSDTFDSAILWTLLNGGRPIVGHAATGASIDDLVWDGYIAEGRLKALEEGEAKRLYDLEMRFLIYFASTISTDIRLLTNNQPLAMLVFGHGPDPKKEEVIINSLTPSFLIFADISGYASDTGRDKLKERGIIKKTPRSEIGISNDFLKINFYDLRHSDIASQLRGGEFLPGGMCLGSTATGDHDKLFLKRIKPHVRYMLVLFYNPLGERPTVEYNRLTEEGKARIASQYRDNFKAPGYIDMTEAGLHHLRFDPEFRKEYLPGNRAVLVSRTTGEEMFGRIGHNIETVVHLDRKVMIDPFDGPDGFTMQDDYVSMGIRIPRQTTIFDGLVTLREGYFQQGFGAGRPSWAYGEAAKRYGFKVFRKYHDLMFEGVTAMLLENPDYTMKLK